MLLAELEVFHTRPSAPTRRVALGNLVLPVDPPPGFGGLLLGAVVAAGMPDVDEDLVRDLHRLIDEVERGERVVQPRPRHRFQVDRHGLTRSTHRLMGTGEELRFDVDSKGRPLAQVLGAIYAVERLEESSRRVVAPVLRKGLRWTGEIGPALMAHLAGTTTNELSALADPRTWALEVLGFEPDAKNPTKRQISAKFRARMRDVHPDHGGDESAASKAILDLAEARRILTLHAKR